jgi:hypothetical protein
MLVGKAFGQGHYQNWVNVCLSLHMGPYFDNAFHLQVFILHFHTQFDISIGYFFKKFILICIGIRFKINFACYTTSINMILILA